MYIAITPVLLITLILLIFFSRKSDLLIKSAACKINSITGEKT